MVAMDPGPSVVMISRAGAPLSGPVGPSAPMDVVRPTMLSASVCSSSGSDEGGKMDAGLGPQVLSRSLSGSKLNAKAPEFVPKSITTLSSSLPGCLQGLGLSPPSVLQASPISIPVVGTPPLPEHQIVPLPVPVVATGSPPAVDLVPAVDGGDVIVGQEQVAAGPPPKPVLSEELKAKIMKQVEFYFSDTNLPTDNYLLKFVKKDPEGFVPIPVVASFRKIKNLVKNHGVVAAVLRNSTQLVVSDDGKKVRRAHPLPEVDVEEVQSRTVVAENLPEDHSIESMEQLFGKVGNEPWTGRRHSNQPQEVEESSDHVIHELNSYFFLLNVKMVRICHPDAANGTNQSAAKYPKTDIIISNKLHALVEYETLELAEKAVAELTDERNWRSGLRVRLLLRRTFQSKHGYQQPPFQKGRKANGDGFEVGSLGEDEDGPLDKGNEDPGVQHADQADDITPNELGNHERDSGAKRGRGRGRGRGAGRARGQHLPGTNGSRNQLSGTPPQTSSSLSSEVVGRPPPGPRMPDGTRGFAIGRGKLLAVNTAA